MDTRKDLPDLTHEEKLKMENDLLKAKLTSEFGMMESDSKLDDEMENQWLNYIYDFEKISKDAGTISIYEFIGKPEFKPIEELSKDEIKSELERLYEIMYKNEIVLDVLCDYENEDELIYKFVTEEFFSLETDNIRIVGMNHCFIYEEFHPNHKHDLTEHSDECIQSLFENDWRKEFDGHHLHKSIEFKNKVYDKDTFMEFIEAFQKTYKPIEVKSKEINKTEFDLDTGIAEVSGRISYTANSENYSGEFIIKFKFNWGFWYINGVTFPNFG